MNKETATVSNSHLHRMLKKMLPFFLKTMRLPEKRWKKRANHWSFFFMTTLICFTSTLSKQKTENYNFYKFIDSHGHLFFLLQSGILILLKSFRKEKQIKKSQCLQSRLMVSNGRITLVIPHRSNLSKFLPLFFCNFCTDWKTSFSELQISLKKFTKKQKLSADIRSFRT